MSAVVDSSVTTVLFTRDGRYPSAHALLERENTLRAPYLILAETANALWKAARLGNDGTAFEAAAQYVGSELPDRLTLCPDDTVIQGALELAWRLKHPVYDCLFIALAVQNDETLYTFDERLIARLNGTSWAGIAAKP